MTDEELISAVNCGTSFYKIKALLGVSRYKVASRLAGLGIKTKAKKARYANRVKTPKVCRIGFIGPMNWPEIRKAYESGLSCKAVGKAFSVSHAMWRNAVIAGFVKVRSKSEASSISGKGRRHSSWSRELMRKKALARVAEGRQNFPSPGTCKKVLYAARSGESVLLHGSWELALARAFDKAGIEWTRPKSRFLYEFEGKLRHYTPDFHVAECDSYVEVKGYTTEKDKARWEQFPERLAVVGRRGCNSCRGYQF